MTGHRHERLRRAGVAALCSVLVGCGGGGGGNTQTGPTPAPPVAGVSLTSLTVTPSTATGCGTVQITATLSGAAPAGGAAVALALAPATTPPSASIAPVTIAIAAGATSGTATLTPTAVPTPPTFTVSGTLAAGPGLTASAQSATVTMAAPIAAFTVSGLARGADACQITNSSGNLLDCTFNGGNATGATTWDWEWQIGGTTRTAPGRTTPTLQPDTGGCGFFGSPAQGSLVQMQVRLVVRDAASVRSCVRQNVNVRVFSGGFCGGF
jgi:hypothetical protein